MSKFCEQCGASIEDTATQCPSCGATQQNTANQTAFTPPRQTNGASSGPEIQLPTDRAETFTKFIILSIVTFGIYALYRMYLIENHLDYIDSKYTGKKTQWYFLAAVLTSGFTGGISIIVYQYLMLQRIRKELERRNLLQDNDPDVKDLIIQYFLLSVIIVGPFIYMKRIFSTLDRLSEDYNRVG